MIFSLQKKLKFIKDLSAIPIWRLFKDSIFGYRSYRVSWYRNRIFEISWSIVLQHIVSLLNAARHKKPVA